MSQNIAIIGSGVAGLTAAWLLGEKNQVTIYEKKPTLGMGHKGLFVDSPAGKVRLDIPPRVINKNHYANLFEILGDAEVETVRFKQQATFSNMDGATYLAFRTMNLFDSSWTLPKFNSDTLGWVSSHGIELLKWIKYIRQINLETFSTDKSLHSFIESLGYSNGFIDSFLLPMWSLMCSCQSKELEKFPIEHLLALFNSFTNSTPSQRIKGGTQALEDQFKSRVSKFHFDADVKEINSLPNQEGLEINTQDGSQTFDHVIVATEPHDAAGLLNNTWSQERDLISTVPFVNTTMYMHTDFSFMPKKRNNWAPVNIFWNKEQNISSATIWMNRVETENPSATPIMQSWDPINEIPKEHLLAQRTFKRSLSSHTSQTAMDNLRNRMESSKDRNLWFVGSYVTSGVPLLENGVLSARLVSKWIESS
jgi:uncharacterized protein